MLPEQMELHEILSQYPTSDGLARLNHEILRNLMAEDEETAKNVLFDSDRLMEDFRR